MLLQIVDPETRKPFPSVVAAGRRCYAVPEGARFAVLCGDPSRYGRREYVVAVDGRDTQTNKDARPDLPGVVASGAYLCKGFQVDRGGVREFVAALAGQGATTAERNGTAPSAGLVACAAYDEVGRWVLRGADALPYYVGTGTPRGELLCAVTTRGDSRGGSSIGAAAGAYVAAELGETTFVRAGAPDVEVVEYDAPGAWAARGVFFPDLGQGDPWPGAAREFASVDTL